MMKGMLPFVVLSSCVLALGVECKSRVASSCIQCDSAVEGQEDCGFVKSSLNGAQVVNCDPALGCFTEVYEKTNTAYSGWYTRRGCLTETKTCTGDDCVTCVEDNNCNKEVFPLSRHKCHKCNQANCANAQAEYCSIYMKNAKDCVTLFETDGQVLLKTCHADLPDSTRDFCNDAKNLDCKKCSGDSCNKASQREGTKCHKCSGSDCLGISTTATLVDCLSSCYIGINSDGEPVRGCSSDFKNLLKCSQKEDATNECFVCEGDGCNSIVYPRTGRRQCHVCNYPDCEPAEDNVEYCSRYHKDEKCATVFAENQDSVIARGCLFSLETTPKEICDKNSTACLTCGYNKCNFDETKLKKELCIGCNSEDDPDCLKANSNLEQRCATNQCFSRLAEPEDKLYGRHMERGCLADLLLATQCIAPDCVSCTGKNCNNQLFPSNRISCKSCKGESCKNSVTDKICGQYVKGEACLTYYGKTNEVIYRDCLADAPPLTIEVCKDDKNLQCSKCIGNLCNIDNKRRGTKCFKCEGLDCVNPSFANEIECLSPCYVGMNAKGEPVRDCANAIAKSATCGKTDSTCLTCNDDHCNGIIYPTADRLTCVKCLGEDCENLNTISEYCERLHADERCVTVFDSAGDVKERGCLSTIQNSATCSGTNANCLKCAFDECNVESTRDEKFHCVSCNSMEEQKCVSTPNATHSFACKVDSCYTRLVGTVGTGQHIDRGCATDIECSSASCQVCKGERCNSQKFPADRHSCHFCSGDHCAIGHLQEKQCTIYSQDKSCITVYGSENEVIYRDCLVDAAQGTRNVCQDSKDLTCSTCTGKLCNNDSTRRGTKCYQCEGLECFKADDPSNSVDCLTGGCYVGLNANGDIKRTCASAVSNSSLCVKSDTQAGSCLVCQGDYCNGIAYPLQNRLVCKECRGSSCEENVAEDKYCERLNVNEKCVSVFNNVDKIIERGCLSTVQSTALCSSTSPNCLKCGFNGCNVEKSRAELYHCVSCDSRVDPNCVTNSTQITTKACTTNQCYSRILPIVGDATWQHVEKGCLAEHPQPSSCTGSNCLACVGDRCNDVHYPSDRFTCQTCRGDECKSATIPSKACTLYNRQKQACITLFDQQNAVVYKGCYSDAAPGTQDVCDDTTQLICSKCSIKNCNNDTTRRGRKCFKCQGLECFIPTHPSDVVDCLSNCYMGVNQRGESVRDCLSAMKNTTACGADDNGVNRCSICTDDNCNGVQFPLKNRLQCHTCNEEGCQAKPDNLEFCQRYDPLERCVTIFSKSDIVVERGCSSSLRNKRYCDQNYENCLQCSASGCNNITSRLERLCVICSSVTDLGCVYNPASIANTRSCKKGCYTRLINGTISRGCYDDLGDNFDCVADNKCKYCNDADKCNVENYPSDRKSCRTCAGIEQCKAPVSRQCLKYKENDSCVTIFSGYQVAHKGCLADVPEVNQTSCATSSSPLCISCSSRDNCNFETVRTDEACIVCNSALDPKCAQKPISLKAEHCAVASEGKCFSRLVNGTTVRGCRGLLTASDAAQCMNNTPSSLCTITTGQSSNNAIIPQNRFTCYQCDSRVDASCSEKPTNSTETLPCKKYSPPESCLKLNLNDGGVIRGCVSDFSPEVCQQGSCNTCNDKKDCNDASIRSIHLLCFALSLIVFLRSIISSS